MPVLAATLHFVILGFGLVAFKSGGIGESIAHKLLDSSSLAAKVAEITLKAIGDHHSWA